MGTRKGSAYIVFDTETTELERNSGQPHPEKSLVYDLGWCVWSSDNELLAERSFVINDVFSNGQAMQNAYYANKLPQYFEGMRNGSWKPVSFLEAKSQFDNDVKMFGVKRVAAFNATFDKKALNHTLYVVSNGFRKYFFPYGTKLVDVWDYSQCITATPQYIRFVQKNNLFTPTGNPKTSAEAVYSYLTKDGGYKEHHTALEDSRIESVIYQAAKKKHCKKPQTIGQGWRGASKLYKQMVKEEKAA